MTLADRLLAVVAADDAIVQAKHLRDTGRRCYTRSAWRGLYAARERADRELWGTHADDRAQAARAILTALDAADAQGYARAMGEVVERCQEPAPIRSGSARVRMAHAAGWGNAMCHVADWAIERCE